MSDTGSRFVMNRELLERLLTNEKEFKEEVLVSLAELKLEVRTLKEGFSAHVKSDVEQFGKVTLSIGENTNTLKYILGGAAAAVFLIGLAAGLVKVFL